MVNKVPTNMSATTNASHGRLKTEMEDAPCSSPPAPTPVQQKDNLSSKDWIRDCE